MAINATIARIAVPANVLVSLVRSEKLLDHQVATPEAAVTKSKYSLPDGSAPEVTYTIS